MGRAKALTQLVALHSGEVVELDRTRLIDADGSSGALVRGRPARFERAINWTHPAYANKHIVHRNNTEIIRASLDANDYSR